MGNGGFASAITSDTAGKLPKSWNPGSLPIANCPLPIDKQRKKPFSLLINWQLAMGNGQWRVRQRYHKRLRSKSCRYFRFITGLNGEAVSLK